MNIRFLFLAAAVAFAGLAGAGTAATIRLLPEASVSGSIVTLGDVASVSGTDADLVAQVEAVELFPSPRGKMPRSVTIREIQDILYARGIDLARHEFTGASRVVVSPAAEPRKDEPKVSGAILRSSNVKAAGAIADYLAGVDPGGGWKAQIELDAAAADALARGRRAVQVTGTKSPTPGPHRFELSIDGNDGPERITVGAVLSKTPPIVVAARPLGIGERIAPSDVRLVPPGNLSALGAFQSIEDVVGMEVGRSVPEGRPLTRDTIIPPVLVNNGKVVSVCVRGGGIRLRTTARARQDGAMGDVISVENPANRAKYLARVVGPDEVEVCNILSPIQSTETRR